MRPSRRLLYLTALIFALGVAAAFLNSLQEITLIVSLALIVLAVIDFASLLFPRSILLTRSLPERFALGQSTDISFKLTNKDAFPTQLRFFDGLPAESNTSELSPIIAKLKGQQFLQSTYRITFQQRGDLIIDRGWIEYSSIFGFWWRGKRIGKAQSIKVYPNYIPVLHYGLLATANRAEQMGIIKPMNKGLSREFHQLRDYQDGDAASQVDWKATSRLNKIISREYQEERDQTILLVTDSSMRTHALDGDLPIFDHLLNAALLFSHIALKQGDKVGILNFGGPERYLPPTRGSQALSQILDHLASSQSSSRYSDYSELASRILRLQQKRALIVILTNLRSEDLHETTRALQLISKKHLIFLASVKEGSVQEALESPLLSLSNAQSYLGALAYTQDIESNIQELRSAGIIALHETLENYPIALANEYLDLRSSGQW